MTRARLALGVALCAVLGAALWFASLEVEPPVATPLAPAPPPAASPESAPAAAPELARAAGSPESPEQRAAAVAPDAGTEAVDARVPDDWCELIEGDTARYEPGSVLVEIAGGATAGGTLEVKYTLRRDRSLERILQGAKYGLSDPPRFRQLAVTRERVTALRCAGIQARFEVALADGRRAYAFWNPDGGTVRLEPRPEVRMRGRVLAGGAPFPGARVWSADDWVAAGADGRFELVFVPEPGDQLALLHAEGRKDGASWTIERATPVSFPPGGGVVEVGDLVMTKQPRGPRGTLGINWAFSGRGPEVEEVLPESPAAKAGVRARDLVVEVDGVAVGTIKEARARMLSGGAPAARLKVQRGSEFLLLDVGRAWEE